MKAWILLGALMATSSYADSNAILQDALASTISNIKNEYVSTPKIAKPTVSNSASTGVQTKVGATVATQVVKANTRMQQKTAAIQANTKRASSDMARAGGSGGLFGDLLSVFDNPWVNVAINAGAVVAATQGEDTLSRYMLGAGSINNIRDVVSDVTSGNIDFGTLAQGALTASTIYTAVDGGENAVKNMGILNTVYNAKDLGSATSQILKDQYGVNMDKYGINTGSIINAGINGNVDEAVATAKNGVYKKVTSKLPGF